jgi:hypothetical protein
MDLRGDQQVLEELVEETELVDCGKVNQRATICDDDHAVS